MKSAAVGRFFVHCNRKSLAAANTQSRFSASNTVLLTCVIGDPPCAHILPSHRSSLQWRTFVPADRSASAWPHAHSTVSCRPCGLLLFAYPARRCTESACITVFQYSVYRRKSSVGTYGREGAPLHDDLLYSVHYDIRFFAVWQANSCYISVFFRKMRKFLVLRLAFTLKMVKL